MYLLFIAKYTIFSLSSFYILHYGSCAIFPFLTDFDVYSIINLL